jgi:hypothetical protein
MTFVFLCGGCVLYGRVEKHRLSEGAWEEGIQENVCTHGNDMTGGCRIFHRDKVHNLNSAKWCYDDQSREDEIGGAYSSREEQKCSQNFGEIHERKEHLKNRDRERSIIIKFVRCFWCWRHRPAAGCCDRGDGHFNSKKGHLFTSLASQLGHFELQWMLFCY